MKRRSFFQSLAKAAAIVALAPQIAFRVRAELPQIVGLDLGDKCNMAFWYQTSRYSACLDAEYMKALARLIPERFHVASDRS